MCKEFNKTIRTGLKIIGLYIINLSIYRLISHINIVSLIPTRG